MTVSYTDCPVIAQAQIYGEHAVLLPASRFAASPARTASLASLPALD